MKYETRDAFMEAVRNYIGERTDEATINFLADLSDNYPDNSEAAAKSAELQAKYDALLADYKNRFFASGVGTSTELAEGEAPQPEAGTVVEKSEEDVTIDDLFE